MKQHLKQYLKRTWKNKVFATVILAINIGIVILAQDATFLVMMLPLILALYFAKRDYVDVEEWYCDK